MPKQTLFTNITPLPPNIPRELASAMLHNHDEMIQLNPLVIEHHPIKAPRDAPADEFLDCVWQEMTDRISYLPGIKGKVSYKACFHDYPSGLQTHIYAPLGVDIREKWSVGGNLPGEPPEPRELGVDKPASGLYLREDGNLRCSRMTHGFVLKNLDVAHKVLVERIIKKAERIDEFFMSNRQSVLSPTLQNTNTVGSHMSNSAFIQAAQSSPRPQSGALSPGLMSPQMLSPQQDADPLRAVHPAYRNDNDSNRQSYASNLPSYASQNQRQSYYSSDGKSQQPPVSPGVPPATTTKQFVAELPGSTYHNSQNLAPGSPHANNRQSTATELSGSDLPNPSSPSLRNSDGGSVTSDGERGGYRYNPQDFARPGDQYGQQDRRSQVSELASPPVQQTPWQTQQRPLR
jgi:hypothetical protein